jgi:hypothetical protein
MTDFDLKKKPGASFESSSEYQLIFESSVESAVESLKAVLCTQPPAGKHHTKTTHTPKRHVYVFVLVQVRVLAVQ